MNADTYSLDHHCEALKTQVPEKICSYNWLPPKVHILDSEIQFQAS